MIRFLSLFLVHDAKGLRVPQMKKCGKGFWCSLEIANQLIMCRVIYLGDDDYMYQNKWYNGIIELPYGEMFHPYGHNEQGEISLNTSLNLKCGHAIIGNCKLLSVKEMVCGSFDMKKDENGNY